MVEQEAQDAAAFETGKQVGAQLISTLFQLWMLNFVIAILVWFFFSRAKYGFPIRALFLGPFHWI